MEPAFEGAGLAEGIEVWRIENFKPVRYPTKDYGKFYTGDSYIVLKTSKSLRDWELYFWLGAETTADEAGSAAILTVQLDDQLGGGPVQSREVQDHESQKFLSLFPNGVRYLPGGVESGFTTHVEEDVTKLFHVKGKRHVRVKEVEASVASMNVGDCFILDKNDKIFIYVGDESSNIEKIKAINVAHTIRDQDHAGSAHIEIVDQYSPEDDFVNFFDALGGGSKDDIGDATDDEDDANTSIDEVRPTVLYQVSDESGELEITKIGEKPFEQSALVTDDCFIVDSPAGIYVWIGRGCTGQEKREAMNTAEKFLKSNNHPSWTRIQRIVEGAEPSAFTQHFQRWRTSAEKKRTLIRADSGISDCDWEPRLIHARIPKRGRRFRIEEVFDFTQADLDSDDIMLLDHGLKLFVWIGKGADDEERDQCETLAEKYVARLQRPGVVVKTIEQGEETSEFKKGFPEWDESLWDQEVNYRDHLKN